VGELLRVNDIVNYRTHYDNGIANNVYAKIDRIVLNGIDYNQLMVTTGYGDSNTRCEIDITYLCNVKTLEPYVGNAYELDPHQIHKPKFSEEIEECLKEIELNKRKIDFFNTYENPSRDKVIDVVSSNIEE